MTLQLLRMQVGNIASFEYETEQVYLCRAHRKPPDEKTLPAPAPIPATSRLSVAENTATASMIAELELS
ncbi:MAG TPA: hypothetical protein VNE62_03720 [Actinomycetota bacterium]|nr:hypothetical protein [Actinomycetota bacterium]